MKRATPRASISLPTERRRACKQFSSSSAPPRRRAASAAAEGMAPDPTPRHRQDRASSPSDWGADELGRSSPRCAETEGGGLKAAGFVTWWRMRGRSSLQMANGIDSSAAVLVGASRCASGGVEADGRRQGGRAERSASSETSRSPTTRRDWRRRCGRPRRTRRTSRSTRGARGRRRRRRAGRRIARVNSGFESRDWAREAARGVASWTISTSGSGTFTRQRGIGARIGDGS